MGDDLSKKFIKFGCIINEKRNKKEMARISIFCSLLIDLILTLS